MDLRFLSPSVFTYGGPPSEMTNEVSVLHRHGGYLKVAMRFPPNCFLPDKYRSKFCIPIWHVATFNPEATFVKCSWRFSKFKFFLSKVGIQSCTACSSQGLTTTLYPE